ncbi:MAG TPA: c-type cytochrome [Solirubrobacteraceae bacterium]|nr:c-type cytochrome [Solirubrobacteraceae bacterium]
MLGVALFVAFWVVLAFGLFFVAARGGLGGARATVSPDTRSSGRVLGLITVIAVVGFGIALPAVLIVGNKDNANGQVAGYKLTASEKNGAMLFGEHCAVCHTLSEGNAVGKVGPNLDMLKPPASLVLHTIQYGCLPNAAAGSNEQCLGQGVMPADVVTGQDATNVAKYVARVAGRQ